ncbi:hypothetical protein CKO45_29070 [Paracraurococcus ruber]|uniref:Uncharacterized protein n=2 Tax=Paracraurococcus ruber TaxID=77675 RepID=A0ABS1D7D2_9PROT|nr:hypothetical protein [Paracraurococcus ruber]
MRAGCLRVVASLAALLAVMALPHTAMAQAPSSRPSAATSTPWPSPPSRAQMLTVGSRALLLAPATNEAARLGAARLLAAPVAATVTAVSLLHPLADAAVQRDMQARWGGRDFKAPTGGLPEIQGLMAARRGERMVVVGHMEPAGSGQATGMRFVTQDGRGVPVQSVPVEALLGAARANDVELVVIGCNCLAAGAAGGIRGTLRSEDLPEILGAIAAARTRADVYAAFSAPNDPVVLRPDVLVASLAHGPVPVARSGHEPVATILHSPQASSDPVPVLGTTEGGCGTEAADAGEEYSLLNVAALLAVAAMVAQLCVILPLLRITRAMNVRHGKLPRTRRLLAHILIPYLQREDRSHLTFYGLVGLGLVVALAPECLQLALGIGAAALACLMLLGLDSLGHRDVGDD